MVSNIVVKSISFITTPFFTRLLTTEEYGTVQTFTSWSSLLIPVFTMNLGYSVGRAKLDYPGLIDEYTGSMQLLSGLFSLLVIGIGLGFLGPLAALLELTEFQTILLFIFLLLHPAIQIYQVKYKYHYQYKQNIAIAWYTAVSTTVLSLVLILLAKDHRDNARITGIVLPTVILSSIFWIRSIQVKCLKINIEYWKYGLKISIPLIFHILSMHVLSQSDRIFITKIWGKTDTAFYSLAYTYGMLLHVFTTAAGEGWLPWFHDTYYAKDFESIRKNVKPMVVLGCYIGLASVALAPEAFLILGGQRYMHALPCAAPIVLGVVCQYIYTQYVNIELHLKKTVYVAAGTITAAVFNIVTNAIFIPRFGFVAAAYTTLTSYFLLMLVHFVITKKILHINLYNDLFMFGALLVTGLITWLLMLTYGHTVVRYTLLLVGFASFLLCFRAYIRSWIKKLKTKLHPERSSIR